MFTDPINRLHYSRLTSIHLPASLKEAEAVAGWDKVPVISMEELMTRAEKLGLARPARPLGE